MNTRKLRKAILTLCSALLLVSLSVGATLAYLTSTDTVVNTFTVGQVEITLDEADVWEVTDFGEGEKVDEAKLGTEKANADRVKANKYKIMPGHNLDKDPTVHVQANSEDCYVRAFVTVNNFSDLKKILGSTTDDEAATAIATYATGYDAQKWTANDWTIENDEVTYEFRWTEMVKQSTFIQDLVLFTDITVPSTLKNEDIVLLGDSDTTDSEDDGLKITVIAQAVQADGFVDADGKTAMEAAWEAWPTNN